ncbi:MAG: MFS transporter [Planctomycetes bacterium]|nr:MFS transporter [Planctomycetota bacterium]
MAGSSTSTNREAAAPPPCGCARGGEPLRAVPEGRPHGNGRAAAHFGEAPRLPAANGSIYNRVFWLAYAANAALVTANALTFRFAEFVAWLGGSERIAGTIVSAGVFGALAARLVIGQGIDRYGTRLMWSAGSLVFLLSCGGFLAIAGGWLPTSAALGEVMYASRIAFAVSVAAMFSCSIVHIQNRVPPERRTEIIGNLGSSGFLGMILGTQLGDVIFGLSPQGPTRYLALFGATAALGLVYLVLVAAITRGEGHVRPRHTPPAHRLLFRYWPGPVVLVAVMMGVSMAVTTVFLTRFATHLGLRTGLGTFFTGYAVSAFIFRVSSSRWSRTMGQNRMILLGLAGHAAGHAMLPFVQAEWQFLLPAVASGFGHALLFPADVLHLSGDGAGDRGDVRRHRRPPCGSNSGRGGSTPSHRVGAAGRARRRPRRRRASQRRRAGGGTVPPRRPQCLKRIEAHGLQPPPP